jgi:hypothetical protein
MLRNKALGIKLKVVQLKHKNINIIGTIIKIMEYDINTSHVVFRVSVLGE